MSRRTLNILQVCDHLGWEGSRMHGVKRLFGWMIPRFAADRAPDRYTDIAIAVSQSTADFVIGARQIPPSKVKVVYLGVPLDEFSRERTPVEIAAARADLGVRQGEFAIGTVTRLHESKGNSFLIDAATRV